MDTLASAYDYLGHSMSDQVLRPRCRAEIACESKPSPWPLVDRAIVAHLVNRLVGGARIGP